MSNLMPITKRTQSKRKRPVTLVTWVMMCCSVSWSSSVQAYVSPFSSWQYNHHVNYKTCSRSTATTKTSTSSTWRSSASNRSNRVSYKTSILMSSIADPQTKSFSQEHHHTNTQMIPTTKVLYTMTSSQVDTFISQRDRERLEASYDLSLLEEQQSVIEVLELKKRSEVSLDIPTKHDRESTISNSSSTTTTTTRGITTINNNHNHKISNTLGHTKDTNSKVTTSRRSSTMPGFTSKHTKRHRSFRDGLKIAQASNVKESKQMAKALQSTSSLMERKKSNSEAMYVNSASVPDSMIAFTHEIHKESRITPKEEAELGMKTQVAISLQRIHSELHSHLGREPTDEEWCAAAGKINMTALEAALQEGTEAKKKLVVSNLRMVQGVVNLYIRNGLGSQYNAGDLMQEGTLALIRAAEKFEPDRGFRFSTYAMYWIRAAVKRSQIFQSRIIEVPQRLHETHKRIVRIETELKKELGRKPNKSELSSAVGLTEKQLQRCKDAMEQQCFSLDAEIQNTLNPNKPGNKDTMHGILAATYDNVELQQIENDIMKQELIDTLRRYLSPTEVKLLLLRFGLMDERTVPYGFSGPLTIAEVSKLVELKPDKVRRMINKSLRHLRDLISHEWEDYELAK